MFAATARTAGENVIIFTSYNSLQRIVDADIEVNTIYFDEAHNSVKRNFFLPLSSLRERRIAAASTLQLLNIP